MSAITQLQRVAKLEIEKATAIENMRTELQALSKTLSPETIYYFCIHPHYNPIRITAYIDLAADVCAMFAVEPSGMVALVEYNAGIAEHLPKIKSILEQWLSQEATA